MDLSSRNSPVETCGIRSNFIRMTDRDCVLPEHGLEEQARVLFGELAKIGALEVLENG